MKAEILILVCLGAIAALAIFGGGGANGGRRGGGRRHGPVTWGGVNSNQGQ